MAFSSELVTNLMGLALEQAKLAYQSGEVPVGAVVARVINNQPEIIAVAHNMVEREQQASSHAEILALRQASTKLSRWRLEDCVLCVTLEPCAMCAGALRLARIGGIIFGARDIRMGAFGANLDLAQSSAFGPVPHILGGVEETRSAELLKQFFKEVREKNAILAAQAAGEMH